MLAGDGEERIGMASRVLNRVGSDGVVFTGGTWPAVALPALACFLTVLGAEVGEINGFSIRLATFFSVDRIICCSLSVGTS